MNQSERGGTSRDQRLLDALLPSYVKVDERDINELKQFVRQYAEQIRFFKHHTPLESLPTWESFFDKNVLDDQTTDPHYALFLAFLRLFKIAQDDLNQITQKHLDFYYRDVLRLNPRDATPDQAYIIFELAKHVHQHLIPEGTRLKAGKDSSGKELIYETNRDIVLNRATVGQIKALYRDQNGRLFTSPMANSADGQGADIETTEKNWQTFGKPVHPWPENERPQAEIGFAIASPLLFLAEGEREITLTLSLKENSSNTLSDLLSKASLQDAFRVRFSGEKDWIEADLSADDGADTAGDDTIQKILDFLNSAKAWQDIAGIEPQAGPVIDDPNRGYSGKRTGYDIGRRTAQAILKYRSGLKNGAFSSLEELRNVKGVGSDKINDLIYTFGEGASSTSVNPKSGTITLRQTLTKDQDPVVRYAQNGDTLTDPFETEWPVMKCTLRTDRDPYIYSLLKDLEFDSITLSVNVDDVRELVVQNDQSVLDPGKDFQPFGVQPSKGSGFYIGNREVFSKRLSSLSLHLKWHGLPDNSNGFEGYYAGYDGPTRSNDSFSVQIHLLDKKKWKSPGEETATWPLFSSDDGLLLPDHIISLEGEPAAGLEEIGPDPHLESFTELDTDTRKGFIRLSLAGTNFGHKEYPSSYTKAVMGAFKADGTFDTGATLPNEPYSPLVKEISLSYSASQLISSEHLSEFGEAEQFFHVNAFGVSERDIGNKTGRQLLFPQYEDEGSLLIGLDNFVSGQTLSLLLQVAEGSADPDLEPQPVQWSYLSNNDWIPFQPFDILGDSTSGLLTSGIIRFSIPKDATVTHTRLPDGKHWIKASVHKDSGACSDLIQITAQAVPVTFSDMGNAPDHLEEPLPADTISKLKVADSAISSIKQPFSSFGGGVEEEETQFYTRVSERLRHKQRAITIWDYERLVLESFPSVYKVKCLNHTRFGGSLSEYSELAPAHTTLIVISNVRNNNAADPLRPKTSLLTLTQIHDFLGELNASQIDLHVKNPVYEEIEVSMNVRFYTGYDSGFYSKQLEDDIKSFLSPWAYDSSSDLELGGTVHKSVILNFVEEQSYVDYLTCFEMYHIIRDPVTGAQLSRKQTDEATAKTSVSVLGSAGLADRYGDHKITVLETDDCACDSNEVKTTAQIATADDCGPGPGDEPMFET